MGLGDVRIYLPTLRGPLPSNNPLILSTHQNITPLALCGGVFCSLLFKKSQNSALLNTARCMFQNIKMKRNESHVGLLFSRI
jgi:hypothetical protein